jgi:hypothetical protein
MHCHLITTCEKTKDDREITGGFVLVPIEGRYLRSVFDSEGGKKGRDRALAAKMNNLEAQPSCTGTRSTVIVWRAAPALMPLLVLQLQSPGLPNDQDQRPAACLTKQVIVFVFCQNPPSPEPGCSATHL